MQSLRGKVIYDFCFISNKLHIFKASLFRVKLVISPLRNPVAQSTPQQPQNVDINANEIPQIPLDLGDDELFNVEGVPLPDATRQRLNASRSQLSPNVSRNIQQLEESLNQVGVNRVQPLVPQPNEGQPIRRVSMAEHS